MTIVVEFSVPTGANPLGEALSVPPRLEVELRAVASFGETYLPYLWVDDREGLADLFESRLRDSPEIAGLTRVKTTADRRLYRLDWNGPIEGGVIDHLTADALTIERAFTADGSWSFRIVSPERDAAEVRDLVHAHETPVTVNRVLSSVTTDPGPEEELSLTSAQRETLRVALERGYFETPRRITLEELGAEFDISRQAVTRRLRRGVREIVAAHCPPRALGTPPRQQP